MGSPNVFWGSRNDLAALCNKHIRLMVFSTSGWIMKTNIVSASSLIIQDETEFRPIISCQNVRGRETWQMDFMGSPDKKFENHCPSRSKACRTSDGNTSDPLRHNNGHGTRWLCEHAGTCDNAFLSAVVLTPLQ